MNMKSNVLRVELFLAALTCVALWDFPAASVLKTLWALSAAHAFTGCSAKGHCLSHLGADLRPLCVLNYSGLQIYKVFSSQRHLIV